MKSMIKENLAKIKEDKIETNQIKPLNRPTKLNKNDFIQIKDQNERLKAFDLMRKKVKNKEEINQLSKLNLENESLNNNVYQGNVFIQGAEDNKRNKQVSNKTELSLLNQFEDYYKNKFKLENEIESETFSDLNNQNKDTSRKQENVKLSYVFGINSNLDHKNNYYVCFHKKEKWVAYLHNNLIIIEHFEKDKERKQKILNNTKTYLNAVKISENGKVLMAYSIESPVIIFYSYQFGEFEDEFRLINKIKIKHNRIIESEISPHNNVCVVLSSNKENETFVTLLDYLNNEILVTTVLSGVNYTRIKWNPYLTNLEFTTLSPRLYTFWRLNSSDVTLQYQHGDFDYDSIEGMEFTCMEFTPPLSVHCTVLLLVAVSNGDIFGIDTKTNSVNIKFPNGQKYSNFTRIMCSLKFISVIQQNRIIIFKLPFLKDINHDDLNVFINEPFEIALDSDITSFDIDPISSNSVALTKKSGLFCISYEENLAVRLCSFVDYKSQIIQTKIISRDYQYYSLRKIDLDNLEMEQMSPEVKDNEYLLITAHKNGVVKVWSVPEYNLLINFEVCTEEVICFDTTPNDLKIAVSYSSGILRFFDINREKFMGKFKSISSMAFKQLRYLPDGQFLFGVDLNNTVFLVKIENYDNLTVQIHQLFNVNGDIIEFKLNPVENYNKILLNLQNVYLHVYNRKFKNILKNSSYDTSVPVFYLQDKFQPDEFFKSNQDNIALKKGIGKEDEYFKYEFSQNCNEKNLVYIMSHARRLILIRNFEVHTINKVIDFNHSPINFSISPTSSFVLYVFSNQIKLNPLGSNEGIPFDLLTPVKLISISLNGKLFALSSDTGIFFYYIKY